MHIEIWTIGRANDQNINEAIVDYTKRISKFVKIEWHLFKNAQADDQNIVRQKEAMMLLQKIQTDECLIVLDRAKGVQLSSEKWASTLQQQIENTRYKKIIILIGGAFGIDNAVLEKAHITISLSSLTFPHQLVRILIAEQLYRAFTIMKNIPYHH